MAASALETQKLCKSFGALSVAESIDFRLEPGARHALIGPNGAGKTTFVNMLTGAIQPAAGVPSQDSGRILEVLAALPGDIAILIIEHDMDLVFRFAQRITVLVQGQVLVEGTPEQIAGDRRVRDVYLGEATHA